MANEFEGRDAQQQAKDLGHNPGVYPRLREHIRAVQERYLTTTTTSTTSTTSTTTAP